MSQTLSLAEKATQLEKDEKRLRDYERFLEEVRDHSQRERKAASRRMLSVFLWCFGAPIATLAFFLLLSKIHMLPRKLLRQEEWVILIFPTLYSVYFFGSEVLVEFPNAWKRGSIGNLLFDSTREARWREGVLSQLRKNLSSFAPDEWRWIAQSFRMDLRRMIERTRYVTALGGAVFFLLVQGIDSLDGRPMTPVVGTPPMAFFEGLFEISTYNLSQFVSLSLFVVLLYLAGSRNHQALTRYYDCLELLLEEKSSGA